MTDFQEHNETDFQDIKRILFRYLTYWPIFVVTLILSILAAFAVNKFKTPLYSVTTTLLINQEKPLIDIGRITLNNDLSSVENEITKLGSVQLILSTLEKLPFQVSYFEEKSFNTIELYPDYPFLIVPDSSKPQPLNVFIEFYPLNDSTFEVLVKNKPYVLYDLTTNEPVKSYEEVNFKDTCILNSYFCNQYLSFTLFSNYNRQQLSSAGKYLVRFESKQSLFDQFNKLNINSNKTSSIITISLVGENIDKTSLFLNTFTETYLAKSVERNLISTNNTISFIERQLQEISDSLRMSENQLLVFKSSKKLLDIDETKNRLFSQLDKLQNKKAEIIVRIQYYGYIKKQLETKGTNEINYIALSNLGVENPVVSNLMEDLVTAINERGEIESLTQKDNPYIQAQDRKIESLRKVLLENVKNLIQTENLSLADLEKNIETLSLEAGSLPVTQRDLFNYERKYKIIDELYTFLLTKRSEVQIAKSAILPENEVIAKADKSTSRLIAPDQKSNYIWATLIGLGIPLLFFFLRDYFNNTIQEQDEATKICGFTSLGKIIHNPKLKNNLLDEPGSVLAENFRFIRTSFQFVCPEKEKIVILVSSSNKGEGKSFVSQNLAMSFSQFNKKTILLNFDLRKPFLDDFFKCKKEIGISNYLIGSCSIEDIICTSNNENFDYILPGPLPPNPSELIANHNTNRLFEYLKNKYDILIIDTPPIGIITDALLLVKYSDANLFVVRQNVTDKNMLKDVSHIIKQHQIKNIYVVFNDFLNSSGKYYGYGYSGYNYQYSKYTQNNNKRNINKTIFHFKRVEKNTVSKEK